VAAQSLVLVLFFTVPKERLSYLWYNVIGCAACVLLSLALQTVIGPARQT
jgi:hypothetical protein